MHGAREDGGEPLATGAESDIIDVPKIYDVSTRDVSCHQVLSLDAPRRGDRGQGSIVWIEHDTTPDIDAYTVNEFARGKIPEANLNALIANTPNQHVLAVSADTDWTRIRILEDADLLRWIEAPHMGPLIGTRSVEEDGVLARRD